MPKARERYRAIRDSLAVEAKEEIPLTHTIYDVIKSKEGKFVVVKIMYNAEEEIAEVEKTNLVFDSPGKADYNSNERNVAERIARLKNGNI